MLDFAIFAVTFLLALVGAVLYLYPVTPGLGLGGAPAPRGPGRAVCRERLRKSHMAPPRSAFLVRMRAVVAGLWSWAGPSFQPCPGRVLGGGDQLVTLGLWGH